ncbi:hypothetical protein [Thermococcus thermotolerans]|uniref:hypothetical protein n=1 Tax=Thermococcus thermotolerans TaxID=2969672 RepID=UPI002157D080|nr:hypothetical protein [Thermococcus thermotolerans]
MGALLSFIYFILAGAFGVVKGSFLILPLILGTLVLMIFSITLRERLLGLIFVVLLFVLRILYVSESITPLLVFLSFICSALYVLVPVLGRNDPNSNILMFASALALFAVVSTVTSDNYVPALIFVIPSILSLSLLYFFKVLIIRWEGI